MIYSYDPVMKRVLDCVASATLLSLFAPIILLVSVIVALDSPGPVLFRQERVGRGGVLFTILKFRTMRVAPAGTGSAITLPDDLRVTKIGATLRRWKLDELPQLWNVCKGDMSLVGPRPEVPKYVAMYPHDVRKSILSVRPGITDEASIKYRSETDILSGASDPEWVYVNQILPDKLAISADYVDRVSFRRDLSILARTLLKVLR